MTTQEAIKILDQIPTKGDEVDAMEMAIEALSAERKGEWVCFGINKLRCLDCGEIAFERKNYCANCGRKMRKEVRLFKCHTCRDCDKTCADMRGGKK